MFLNKFFHFLKGYVILIVTGLNVERFLYICARRGIDVWGIERKENLGLSMYVNDFFKIRPIVKKTHVKVHIKRKMGLPILLKRYKKRHFVFWGCVLFILIIFISSHFVWSVEIIGAEKSDEAEIRTVLEEAGIYVGAFKGKVSSQKEIKNIILNKVDNISWAWVYLKGTKAICEIYEDSIPQMSMEDGEPCNIIAARDGIIKKVIARNGIKTVSEDDAVLAGEILISGSLLDSEGNIGCIVEAMGSVEAYTWHEKKGTYKLYHETKIPTGRKKTFRSFKFFSKQFDLYKNNEYGFENYITKITNKELMLLKDLYMGISLKKDEIYEVEIVKEPISYDMAVYEGQCDLEKKIAKELLPGAELLEENVFHSQIDDETVEVCVTMKFVEKIGRKAPIN